MKQNLIIYSTSILITALAALFFQIVGYPFVITSTETMEIVAPPIYGSNISSIWNSYWGINF